MEENKVLLLDKPYDKINYKLSDQLIFAQIPVGLWYVINEYWLAWAMEKNYKSNYLYSIVTESSHIFKIDDYQSFMKFTDKFSYKKDKTNIAWQKVAKYYDGIEVNFKFEKDKTWLSNKIWEHPIGCIWSKDAINKLHKITVDNEEI